MTASIIPAGLAEHPTEEQTMTDRSFVQRNADSRARLEALLNHLSDAQLARPLSEGWTIAAALAHVAFWDRRAWVLVRKLQAGPVADSPADVDPDVLNDALLPQWLLLPPRAVVAESRAAMLAVDSALEAAPDAVIERVRSGDLEMDLLRSNHRDEHVEEIERALSPES
jgi:hypothetical protein